MMMCCVYLPFFKKIIFNEQQWPMFLGYTVFYSIRIFEVYTLKISVKNVEFSKNSKQQVQ